MSQIYIHELARLEKSASILTWSKINYQTIIRINQWLSFLKNEKVQSNTEIAQTLISVLDSNRANLYAQNFDAALKGFQKANGLIADGIFGEKTCAKMQALVLQNAIERIKNEFSDLVDIKKLDVNSKLVRVPAYKDVRVGGYDFFVFRPDAAYFYLSSYKEALSKGVCIQSAGSLRPLNAELSAGRIPTSVHYGAAALDIAVYAGMANVERDMYVVERGNDGYWNVWAKPNPTLQINAIDMNKVHCIVRPITYKNRTGEIVGYVGELENLTDIFKSNHFMPIRPQAAFLQNPKSSDMTAEWWHFQCEFCFMPFFTTFADSIKAIYDASIVAKAPQRILQNANKVYCKDWHVGFFIDVQKPK